MHTSYIRPGGVFADATPRFLEMLDTFIHAMPAHVDEYEDLLTMNPIWRARTIGIGRLSPDDAKVLGASGPMIRGSGIAWDLRKKQPYEVYDKMKFDIPLGTTGDCYDRYLVRVQEMRESNKIITQCIAWLRANSGPVITASHKVAPPSREEMKTNMEELIHHFKLFTEGMHVPPGEVYAAVEHPKGEFGVYIISDGANKPYRLKLRPPGFAHLSALDEMARGHMIADVVAIIGTQDIVFGDIDR
jgi:NADH-quinone oxidoreductase subunit D